MKFKIAAVILLAWATLARADEAISHAQQVLKDQGFYYGEITGEKNTETTAAIRRYQIRNGLQVTGELDSDTVKLLGQSASAPRPQHETETPPSPNSNAPQEDRHESGTEPHAPLQPFDNPWGKKIVPHPAEPYTDTDAPPPDQRSYPSNPPAVPPGGPLFAGTPYQTAPPEVQRDVIASAQRILADRDLYRGEIDGIFGPGTEFSLRAYQSRVGLRTTGQLDLETLAALELLPGAHRRVFTPRWRAVRPPPGPAVRGEWVHP